MVSCTSQQTWARRKTSEDLQQALHYAAAAVDDERLSIDRVA
jgi:hypothetical protein